MPTISRFTLDNDGKVEFSDSSWLSGDDAEIGYVATGHGLSQPFLEPYPVRPDWQASISLLLTLPIHH